MFTKFVTRIKNVIVRMRKKSHRSNKLQQYLDHISIAMNILAKSQEKTNQQPFKEFMDINPSARTRLPKPRKIYPQKSIGSLCPLRMKMTNFNLYFFIM